MPVLFRVVTMPNGRGPTVKFGPGYEKYRQTCADGHSLESVEGFHLLEPDVGSKVAMRNRDDYHAASASF